MNALCFIDLFDSAAFRGERRRIFGPAHLDPELLGLVRDARMSVRVGKQATLFIDRANGSGMTIQGGEALESLEADSIRSLEVRPTTH